VAESVAEAQADSSEARGEVIPEEKDKEMLSSRDKIAEEREGQASPQPAASNTIEAIPDESDQAILEDISDEEHAPRRRRLKKRRTEDDEQPPDSGKAAGQQEEEEEAGEAEEAEAQEQAPEGSRVDDEWDKIIVEGEGEDEREGKAEEVEGMAEAEAEAEAEREGGEDLVERSKRQLERLKKKAKAKRRRRREESEEEGAAEKEPEEGNDADGEGGGKRKKKKKKKRHKKRRRSEAQQEGADEAGEGEIGGGGGEEEEEESSTSGRKRCKKKERTEKSDFDLVLEDIRRSYRRRRKEQEIEEAAQAELQSRELLAEMEEAAEADRRAVEAQEPALARLRLLPRVTSALARKAYQEALLREGLLAVLRRWLEPGADGRLPPLPLRQQLLPLLRRLPVDTEELKTSGIGRVVMALWHSREETPANRRLCEELIDRWSRPLFGLADSYSEGMREQLAQEAAASRRPGARLQLRHEDPAQALIAAYMAQKGERPATPLRARAPQPDALDFVRLPQSAPSLPSPAELPKPLQRPNFLHEAKYSKVFRNLRDYGKPGKSQRAASLSVEGRNLHLYISE
jgi:transcription factor SPN1